VAVRQELELELSVTLTLTMVIVVVDRVTSLEAEGTLKVQVEERPSCMPVSVIVRVGSAVPEKLIIDGKTSCATTLQAPRRMRKQNSKSNGICMMRMCSKESVVQ
jgi:hypothetical protein